MGVLSFPCVARGSVQFKRPVLSVNSFSFFWFFFIDYADDLVSEELLLGKKGEGTVA